MFYALIILCVQRYGFSAFAQRTNIGVMYGYFPSRLFITIAIVPTPVPLFLKAPSSIS